ncbi:MAG: TetR/AcrR family transcriptional regulator [Pseudomonas sp.]|uniref:TetR/AcrR family transcriptional regulator n=1 Tax=Pseudomonas sp. TaxID=306 RepID=UPI00272110A3|nr:TetR/AcrR family transcriptional regulator [Pseudomonas sp.]
MFSIASPTQARSKQALERFLNVAAEQLANNSFEETGIAQLAQLAESSVGTFYRLLGDKDVLLYAVHSRFVEQAQGIVDGLSEELKHSQLPLNQQIERFISSVIAQFEGNEGLLRALIRRSSVDLQFRQRFHHINAYISQAFCQLVLAHAAELQHPQPEQAADLAAHLLLAGMNYFTMVGTFGSTPPKVIPHELARLICSYLQAA